MKQNVKKSFFKNKSIIFKLFEKFKVILYTNSNFKYVQSWLSSRRFELEKTAIDWALSALHFGYFLPGMSVADGGSQIPAASGGIDDQSLKLAIAISLLRSKAIQNQQHQHPPTVSSPPSSDSDALRWKRKVSLYASSFYAFFYFRFYWRSLIEDVLG